jgi:hypothetical protein
MCTQGFDTVRRKRMQWRGEQAGLLLGEDLGNCAAVVTRPAALMRHLIAPRPGLAIALS